MSPYVEQVAAALAQQIALYSQEVFGCGAEPTPSELHVASKLAPRVDAALMRAYWQGCDDGMEERGKIQPTGAAGRGVLAALGELRGSLSDHDPHTPTRRSP